MKSNDLSGGVAVDGSDIFTIAGRMCNGGPYGTRLHHYDATDPTRNPVLINNLGIFVDRTIASKALNLFDDFLQAAGSKSAAWQAP